MKRQLPPALYRIEENTLTPDMFQSMRLECGMKKLETDIMKAALDNSIFTLRAVIGGRTIGMMRMVGDGALVFMIYDLLVSPEYRRLGVATMIVLRGVEIVRSGLTENVWASVNLFSAPGKEIFYKKLGFTELPHENMGAGMQMFVRGF